MKPSRIINVFSRIVNILWWLSLAGLALLAAAGIMLVVVRPWSDDEGLSLTWASSGLSIDFTVPGGQIGTNDFLVVTLFFGSAVVLVAITAIVLYQLRAVMASIRTGIRFGPETAGRLRFMGWMLIAGSVITGMARTYAASYVASRVVLEGVSFGVRPGIDWMMLFMGFVLFVLAEIWRRAAELQEESDLTV